MDAPSSANFAGLGRREARPSSMVTGVGDDDACRPPVGLDDGIVLVRSDVPGPDDRLCFPGQVEDLAGTAGRRPPSSSKTRTGPKAWR